MEEKPMMTIAQTAEYLNLPKGTIYGLVHTRYFPAIKIGKQWRIPCKKLDRWVEDQLKEKAELII